MPFAARIGDMHTCPMVEPGPVPHVGGPILPAGCPTVLIEGLPAAREGDKATCVGPLDAIARGAVTVLIGYMPAARVGDPTTHGGVIVSGCATVSIGDSNGAQSVSEAALGLLSRLSEAAKELWYSIFGERYNDGIVIRGSREFRAGVKVRLDQLDATASGKRILDELAAQGRAGKGVTIVETGPGGNQCTPTGTWENAYPTSAAQDPGTGRINISQAGSGTTSEVEFNPDYEPTYPDGSSCRSAAIGLGHELLHAVHNGNGVNLSRVPDPTDPGTSKPSNHEEAQTIGRGAYSNDSPTDNSLRQEMGYKARTSHGSVCP